MLDNERAPRAAFLTLVAFEELLKSRYTELAPTDDWRTFWQGFPLPPTKTDEFAT